MENVRKERQEKLQIKVATGKSEEIYRYRYSWC